MTQPSDREPPGVVVIGGANVDLEAAITGPVGLGDSNPATFRRGAGGVGRNIAANLALLGVATSLVTVFDDSDDGRWLAQATAADGVDLRDALTCVDAPSTYLAVVDDDGDLVVGANDMRGVAHLTPHAVDDRWALFAAAETLVIDANLPTETIRHLAASFPEARVVAEPVSALKAQRLRPHLRWLDMVKPNRIELEALADHPVNGPDDVSPAIDEVLRLGVRCVVVSFGSEGVIIATENERHKIPAIPAEVVSATGAGDAMAAGLILGLTEGWDLRTTARAGQAMAALNTGSAGTTASALTRARLLTMMEAHP